VVRRVLVAGRHAIALGSGPTTFLVVSVLRSHPVAQAFEAMPHAITIGSIHARGGLPAGFCAMATVRAGLTVALRSGICPAPERTMRPAGRIGVPARVGKARSGRLALGQRRAPRGSICRGWTSAVRMLGAPVTLACHLGEPAGQVRMLAEQLTQAHRPAQVLVGRAGMHAPTITMGAPGLARPSIARAGVMCPVMIRRSGRMLLNRFVGACDAGTCRGGEHKTDR